ncbi:MAG: YmaF family protein [Sporomusa sp.]|nr:YmaF family protein [Sporomusa sp.]
MSENCCGHHNHTAPAHENTNHNHAFITIADVARDHQHGILGTSGPAIYSDHSHVHRIYVRTTSDPKGGPIHWHLVDVTTGPAIEVSGDEHTHQFCGETSLVLGHDHCFNSTTDTAPDQKVYDCEND